MRAVLLVGVIVALTAVTCGDPSRGTAAGPGHDRDGAAAQHAWRVHEDADSGIAVEVPPGWHVADETQTPNLGEPTEILRLATVPLEGRSASRCAHQPGAVEQFGAGDALVTVQERRTLVDAFPPRPLEIREFTYGTGDLASAGCFRNTDEIVHERVDFRDAGRAFSVYATYSADHADELRETVLRLVNSLTVRSL